MMKESNLKKVKVPVGYEPQIKLFYYKKRKSWACDYFLPSHERIPFRRYLPRDIFNTERKAKAWTLKKRDALLGGILNLSEYKKLVDNGKKDDLNFKKALNLYQKLTSLHKTVLTIERERHHISIGFNFLEKELGKKFLSDVSEKDVRLYRLHLIERAKLRKEALKKYQPLIDLETSYKKKKEISKKINSIGLAPSTAESYFSKFKKVFNKLYKEKIIEFNPCSDIENIKISITDRIRKNTFSPEDIVKLAECDYENPRDFPLQKFVLFLAETGARSGEALHLEWSDLDFENHIWKIKEKPKCPTKRGLGWKPKWGKERDVFLSQSAIEILNSIDQTESFGCFYHEDKKDMIYYPANFVFTQKCRKTQKRIRTNCVKKSWKALIKKAGIDDFILHDFRRYRNVVDECIYRLSLKERGEKLGNSPRVNSTHYKGVASSELIKASGQVRELASENLKLEAKIKLLEAEIDKLTEAS